MLFARWSLPLHTQRLEVSRTFLLLLSVLTPLGKSLEEIDEIFGDIKIIHESDVKFEEKMGIETVETRNSAA